MNNVQGEELGELVKKLMNDPQVAEIVRNLRESGAADEAKKAADAALTEQAAQTCWGRSRERRPPGRRRKTGTAFSRR